LEFIDAWYPVSLEQADLGDDHVSLERFMQYKDDPPDSGTFPLDAQRIIMDWWTKISAETHEAYELMLFDSSGVRSNIGIQYMILSLPGRQDFSAQTKADRGELLERGFKCWLERIKGPFSVIIAKQTFSGSIFEDSDDDTAPSIPNL